MSGVLLAVNPLDVILQTKPDQGCQRQFGAIGYAGEHRLPEHGTPQVDAIQARLQLAIHPGLHAVGDAHFVQLNISLDHVFGDPGALLLWARAAGAGPHDSFKLSVESDFEAALRTKTGQGLPQAAPHPKALSGEHHAGIGAPPQDGLTIAEPGKDTVLVGSNQGCWTEVGASCQQSWQGVERSPALLHGGEGLASCEKGQLRWCSGLVH